MCPGVSESRAMRPSSRAVDLHDRPSGGQVRSARSAMFITGAARAGCAELGQHDVEMRAATQAAMAASSSSRWATRPEGVEALSSPTPTGRAPAGPPTRPTCSSPPTCRRPCGRCCGAPCRGCPSRGWAARSRAWRRPTAAAHSWNSD
jgi:hypothetical protein